MVDRRRILIATGNLGKLREVQAILADLPVELVTLADGPSAAPHPPVPTAPVDGASELLAASVALEWTNGQGAATVAAVCWSS